MIDSVLIAAAHDNFWAFCYYYDREFFSDKRPFLYDIAQALQDIADGKIRKLSVSFPPRAGKSYLTTLFSAWIIGRNPEGSVMRCSTTATLYNKFSYDTREVLKSEKFRHVFPQVVLSGDKQSVTGWNVTEAKQVSYFGNGVGGTIIGFGASLVAITDDLYRGHDDAMSETINDKTHRWYESSFISRIEKDCPQVDIGTRWSIQDVIGKNIADGYYDRSIIVPALINNETFCDDVKSTEEYYEIKDRTDEFIWNSEYMQEPVELAGTIFPASKLNRYDDLPPEGIDVCFGDPADEGDNYYSCPFGRIVGSKVYIYDAVYNMYNVTINEPVLLAKFIEYKTVKAYIESNSFGRQHIEILRGQTDTTMFGVMQTVKKMVRILLQSGYIIQNFYFPNKSPGPEYDKFFLHLTSLLRTGTKNDDACDSLSGLSFMCRRDYIL